MQGTVWFAALTRRNHPALSPSATLGSTRAKFLRSLLEREQLFATDVGKSLEQQARANIAHELQLVSVGLLLDGNIGGRARSAAVLGGRGAFWRFPATGCRGGVDLAGWCGLSSWEPQRPPLHPRVAGPLLRGVLSAQRTTCPPSRRSQRRRRERRRGLRSTATEPQQAPERQAPAQRFASGRCGQCTLLGDLDRQARAQVRVSPMLRRRHCVPGAPAGVGAPPVLCAPRRASMGLLTAKLLGL